MCVGEIRQNGHSKILSHLYRQQCFSVVVSLLLLLADRRRRRSPAAKRSRDDNNMRDIREGVLVLGGGKLPENVAHMISSSSAP